MNLSLEVVSRLAETEGVILVLGIAWNIYRELKSGSYLKKVLKDIEDSANSPLVDMLRKTITPGD